MESLALAARRPRLPIRRPPPLPRTPPARPAADAAAGSPNLIPESARSTLRAKSAAVRSARAGAGGRVLTEGVAPTAAARASSINGAVAGILDKVQVGDNAVDFVTPIAINSRLAGARARASPLWLLCAERRRCSSFFHFSFLPPLRRPLAASHQ